MNMTNSVIIDMKLPTARNIPYKVPEKIVGPMIVALTIFWLIFHVLSGSNGVYSLLKEERRLELLKAELSQVAGDRKDLEHKVHLMSDKTLDADMLDEQARTVLDDASENEVVIPLKK